MPLGVLRAAVLLVLPTELSLMLQTRQAQQDSVPPADAPAHMSSTGRYAAAKDSHDLQRNQQTPSAEISPQRAIGPCHCTIKVHGQHAQSTESLGEGVEGRGGGGG